MFKSCHLILFLARLSFSPLPRFFSACLQRKCQIIPGYIFPKAGNGSQWLREGTRTIFQGSTYSSKITNSTVKLTVLSVLLSLSRFVLRLQPHSIPFLCLPVKQSSRHPAKRPDVSVLWKPQVIDLPCLEEDTTPAERWIDAEPPIPEPRLVGKKWQSDTSLNPSAGRESPLTTSFKVFSFTTTMNVIKTNKTNIQNTTIFGSWPDILLLLASC